MPIKSRIKNSKNVDNATPSTHGAKAGIVRAIIVAPTRELASQIQREVRRVFVQSIASCVADIKVLRSLNCATDIC